MDSKNIRDKYIKFFVDRGHKEIASAKLIPENDPTTLFTSSGMQPLVPYLLGQEHPEGKRLVDSQPSFRAEDIEEVGDNRHTTFFEMLGNWSLGDYFKKEQILWFWEFLTKELNLPKEKLSVSVFEGNKDVPKDNETYEIWKSLGVSDDHIFFYGVDKNWWSRSGTPDKMPEGEIGGPDSEVFYEFTRIPHDEKFGKECHPNCDCGRFLEIGNSVFIQYQKIDGKLKELSQKNVDFGGGLERLTAATLDTPDIFKTDLYKPICDAIAQAIGTKYEENPEHFRVIADHLKAATFLVSQGLESSNKLQGYVLRRLLRRAYDNITIHYSLQSGTTTTTSNQKMVVIRRVVVKVIDIYSQEHDYDYLGKGKDNILNIMENEVDSYVTTTTTTTLPLEKQISGKEAFQLYQSHGISPIKLREEGYQFDQNEFDREFKNHQELSRTQSAGMFKGGLADHSEVVTKYHTATHLLHQALRDVLGPQVFQKGSNITSERLRFDFSFDRKMTDEEVKAVENIVNGRIEQDLKVDHMIVDLKKAKEMNAIGLFDEKYADKVSIYGVGPGFSLDLNGKDKRNRGGYYSLEFCGGPHVEHTGVIGKIKITKEESISSGIRRIKAQIVN